MSETTMARLYVECACGSSDHLLMFMRDDDAEWPETLVSVQMNHTRPWWKRLAIAASYVAGRNPKLCHWGDTMLDDEARGEIVAFLAPLRPSKTVPA